MFRKTGNTWVRETPGNRTLDRTGLKFNSKNPESTGTPSFYCLASEGINHMYDVTKISFFGSIYCKIKDNYNIYCILVAYHYTNYCTVL